MPDYEALLHNLAARLADCPIRTLPGKYLADCPEKFTRDPKKPFVFPPSIGWDNNHFPCDYALLVRLGLPGIVARARAERDGLSPEQQALREAVAKAYELVIGHVARFAADSEGKARETGDPRLSETAENCRALCMGPPATFRQGVQLVWFIFQLRGFHRSSLGRLDQALWPLYRADVLAKGRRDEAFAILKELWENFNLQCSGDTLMNLMLGGVDREGNDATDDLSLLMMEVTRAVAQTEPHINLRLHAGSPEAYLKEACRLIAMGQGQGVLYLDEALIPSLTARGIPLALARDYANDGCTEITFNGQSGILFWQMEMVKTLELTLFNGRENPSTPRKAIHKWAEHVGPAFVYKTQLAPGHETGDVTAMESFEELYAAFKAQMAFQVDGFLAKIDAHIRQIKEDPAYATSLLLSGMCEKTLDAGIDPMRGGYPVENYQLLSGSIPTTADALTAIKTVVFEKRLCTMAELLASLEQDFAGCEALREALLHAPKFGNDIPEVDNLAADIAAAFMAQVEAHEAPYGIKLLPGLYNIDFHMMGSALAASADGRHHSDLVCDHYSPTPGRAVNGPTAILHSAAAGNPARGCASSPLQLALPRTENDRQVTRWMIDAIRAMNLPVVSLTFQDAKELKDAMAHPEAHRDLVVRVWGFNARFVELDPGLQEHIIRRTLANT